jgi:hypothetical protein
VFTWLALLTSVRGTEITQAVTRLYERFNVAVDELAASASSDEARQQIAAHRLHFDPSRRYYYASPDRWAVAAGEPSPEPRWDGPLAELYEAHAGQLLEIARAALDQNDGRQAYALLHQVLYFSPQHAEVRRWLGLPEDAPGRRTPGIVLRRGRRRHARLGWPAGGYWQATTPHFQITSNDTQPTTARLAMELERIHAVWEQLCFDSWNNADRLRAWRDGRRERSAVRRRHNVVLLRSRDDYLRVMRPLEPRAELTRGYYHVASQTAYFVGGDAPTVSTWYHEATHQLFAELPGVGRHAGQRQNVWIIEGIALYLESLQPCRRWLAVGGLDADRLQYARFRRLRAGQHVPLETVVALDQSELQADERIRGLYSQFAGFTHFLLHGEHGRWQQPTLRYIDQVYAQQDSIESLARLAETPLAELDDRYAQFLNVTDDDLRQLDPDIRLVNLSLGGTPISDAGLLCLSNLDRLAWLDLYGTRITDRGTVALTGARELRQLSLENTQIGDVTVARLRGASRLQQLDLSGTQVTDLALATVGALTNLESLWLTNTAISDEGLNHLHKLPQLTRLDLAGTKVTSAGIQKLAEALPNCEVNATTASPHTVTRDR